MLHGLLRRNQRTTSLNIKRLVATRAYTCTVATGNPAKINKVLRCSSRHHALLMLQPSPRMNFVEHKIINASLTRLFALAYIEIFAQLLQYWWSQAKLLEGCQVLDVGPGLPRRVLIASLG